MYATTGNTIGTRDPRMTAENTYMASGLVTLKYIQPKPEVTMSTVAPNRSPEYARRGCAPKKSGGYCVAEYRKNVA
jgi:hypothetical protein